MIKHEHKWVATTSEGVLRCDEWPTCEEMYVDPKLVSGLRA